MKDYIISGPENLELILKPKSGFTGKFKVQIDQLDAEENSRYEKKLNDLYNACGCELGAVFCFVSMIGYITFSVLTSYATGWILLRDGLIVLFFSALMGKITGIVLAKFRLKKMVRELIKKLR